MKTTDIIRSVLDIIDGTDETKEPVKVDIAIDQPDEEQSAFRQIYDLLSKDNSPCDLANAPDEQYADIDAVTVLAGGGPNKPKHPHDIRVKDPSLYPGQQEY